MMVSTKNSIIHKNKKPHKNCGVIGGGAGLRPRVLL